MFAVRKISLSFSIFSRRCYKTVHSFRFRPIPLPSKFMSQYALVNKLWTKLFYSLTRWYKCQGVVQFLKCPGLKRHLYRYGNLRHVIYEIVKYQTLHCPPHYVYVPLTLFSSYLATYLQANFIDSCFQEKHRWAQALTSYYAVGFLWCGAWGKIGKFYNV